MRLSPTSYDIAPRASQFVPRSATGVTRPHAQWLRRQRQARGWSVIQMARQLRTAATAARDTLPAKDSLIVMIRRWEDGRSGISERYRLHYCRAFQLPADGFGKPTALDSLPAGNPGRPGTSHAAGPHLNGNSTQRSLRDQMHVAVDQLYNNEDRDQFCFLLGYVYALMTAIPRDPGEGSQSVRESGEGVGSDD